MTYQSFNEMDSGERGRQVKVDVEKSANCANLCRRLGSSWNRGLEVVSQSSQLLVSGRRLRSQPALWFFDTQERETAGTRRRVFEGSGRREGT